MVERKEDASSFGYVRKGAIAVVKVAAYVAGFFSFCGAFLYHLVKESDQAMPEKK